MEIETLQREILEAKRLIERNTLILQLNEQSVTLQKGLTEAREEISALKEAIATKEPEPAHVD